MEDYNYYQVQGWMVNNLNLKGNELICYAVIYSFSQDEESKYMGGVKYLQSWINASEPTVISILDKLTSKGLIEPTTAITKTCKRIYYRVTKDSLVRGNLRNLSKVTKDSLGTLYNNNNNNIDNNKKVDGNKLPSTKKDGSSTRFVKPTIEQIDAYIREKNLHFGAEQFFDYYESKGWMIGSNHMKDWKAACRTWEHKRNSQEKKEEPTEETQYPAGMDAKKWNEITFWMCAVVPRISGKINPETFVVMQQMAKDSHLLSTILKAVEYRFTFDISLDVMEVFKEELKNYQDEQKKST
jgi:hypothetical protein